MRFGTEGQAVIVLDGFVFGYIQPALFATHHTARVMGRYSAFFGGSGGQPVAGQFDDQCDDENKDDESEHGRQVDGVGPGGLIHFNFLGHSIGYSINHTRMHLHEFQAKDLFRACGIPVPAGQPACNIDEAEAAAGALGGNEWVVKAQVHSGGRGKAGGVCRVEGRESLRTAVGELLGSRLQTHQTGPEGLPVSCVLVESPTDIQHEFYLSLLVDRACRRVAVIASAAGGMEIEEVAASSPEKILHAWIDPVTGFQTHVGRRLGFELGLEPSQVNAFVVLLGRLYGLFVDTDAALVEINPLVITGAGELLALDAKINLDDNALYRHADLAELRDPAQEDAREARAREHALNYIHLDGDIGCMVNGAGLAMATMDLIKLHGGHPANFLDVGGTATAERVAEAFKLILSDTNVRAVLVNIFGGIVRCDLIAEGILQAVREVRVSVPVVVRLEGTNAEAGRTLLADSGMDILAAQDLTEAARTAVTAAQNVVSS
jgi:succinyl-CoA synthetase beta subunit